MAIQPLTDAEKRELRNRMAALELEHSDLNHVIDRIGKLPEQDELQLRRLKKKKLLLKDEIERVRARLIPDIFA